MTHEELLARGMAALAERFEKAGTDTYQVKAKADRLFAVTNGDGQTYEVDFRTVKTGVCTCPDFQKRGARLYACKHTARVVLSQWPDNYERYQAKVRELATASIATLSADPDPSPVPPTPPPTAPATLDAALVTAVVEATLPIVMALVMDTLAASTADVTASVLAALAKEVKQQ